ncbi:MAG TPA: hypothetical protein VGX23_05175 [Actinocrinis sp.]|nr:hypothetical protein [Actinocrinis sp.]
MSAQEASDDLSYLLPLFIAVKPWSGPDGEIPRPGAQPRSSLAADDVSLGSWRVSILANSTLSAGLMHVHALIQLVTVAKVVDPYSPWTLLRAALENFATSAWLLSGTRNERWGRALSLWHEDFHNRAQHEQDTGRRPSGPRAKSGEQRRNEVKALADSLGLAIQKPGAGQIITIAAGYAGLNADQTRASWRVASGFAHGRFWPNMSAAQPWGATPLSDGYLFALVLNDNELERLANACKALFEYALSRYQARSLAT